MEKTESVLAAVIRHRGPADAGTKEGTKLKTLAVNSRGQMSIAAGD